MKEEITKRLSDLREQMKAHQIQAYIIPSSDHHLGEYVPECWKDREWISGFNGSAGTVVVTMEDAGLWTDSRYFLQAGEQLEGSTITLYKMGLPDTPSISQFIRTHKSGIHRVGFQGKAMSLVEATGYARDLAVAEIELVTDVDLVTAIRPTPPQIPLNKFFVQPLELAGRSVEDKVADIRTDLHQSGANAIILNMLDEIAWLFNVRGTDVDYNPVGIAYGMLTEDCVCFYVLEPKLTPEVSAHLKSAGVTIKPYEQIYQDVAALPSSTKLVVDPVRTNYALYLAIPKACMIVNQLSPITLHKACKNDAEYQGCKRAMKRDGVALTRFYIWLEKTLADGQEPDEVEIDKVLASFRAQSDKYVSDSFGTICGYNGHGAIVHYSAKRPTAYKLQRKGMLLLDSGAQYHDGTTDITRTLSLDGHPTRQQMEDYTRVLKGHIAIATAIFPQGTRGSQLDILARKALWDECKNFGHGTGHGVGHFLNVHEGPQNIRMDENPTTLRPGMVTSNEPGLYITDKYGIRIENLIRTIPLRETEFGNFYTFETVTLCYMDNALVAADLLTDKELKWYNDYQERVYQELSPELNADEAKWLREKTRPVQR